MTGTTTDVESESKTVPDEGPQPVGEETSSGLDQNVAGALCYFMGFVTGLIFYLVEEDNEFVRFHATQSMIAFGGLFVLSFVLGFLPIFFEVIPFVGWIFSLAIGLIGMLLWPIALVLWIVLMVKAYRGDRYRLPIVGEMAEGHA